MSKVWAIVCALLFGQQAYAQNGGGADFQDLVRRVQSSRPTVSTSGQFAVFEAPSEGWRSSNLTWAEQSNYVQLNAALVAFACDRIKGALLQDLGAPDEWRGRMAIYLRRARTRDDAVIAPPPENPGMYYVSVPDKVDRNRFVTAVVSLVLEEIGNRTADKPVEVPVWLAEGLSQEIMHEHPYDLVPSLPPVGDQGMRLERLTNYFTNTPPLKWAKEILRERGPLTLDQLAWPAPGDEENPVYRGSAQLLVTELLKLNDGRACMRAFVPELAKHLNWQVAFMAAFKSHFATRLELEKWWELCVVRFTGRDLSESLSSEDSWKRLDDLLRAHAQVRTSNDELPLHTEVKLQDVIGGWSPGMQEAMLKEKLQYLATLRNAVAPEAVPFVDGYQQALLAYVKERDKAGLFRDKKKSLRVVGMDKPAVAAIRELDALDARRREMESAGPAMTSSQIGSVSH